MYGIQIFLYINISTENEFTLVPAYKNTGHITCQTLNKKYDSTCLCLLVISSLLNTRIFFLHMQKYYFFIAQDEFKSSMVLSGLSFLLKVGFAISILFFLNLST